MPYQWQQFVFPAKTPWKENMKVLVVDWLLWGPCRIVHEDLIKPPYHETSAVLLHITNTLKINTTTNEM